MTKKIIIFIGCVVIVLGGIIVLNFIPKNKEEIKEVEKNNKKICKLELAKNEFGTTYDVLIVNYKENIAISLDNYTLSVYNDAESYDNMKEIKKDSGDYSFYDDNLSFMFNRKETKDLTKDISDNTIALDIDDYINGLEKAKYVCNDAE